MTAGSLMRNEGYMSLFSSFPWKIDSGFTKSGFGQVSFHDDPIKRVKTERLLVDQFPTSGQSFGNLFRLIFLPVDGVSKHPFRRPPSELNWV